MQLGPAVVLVQPRIPQNVGAVARVCAATGASLHVVRPIPFELSDRSLRRAGMDYLELLELHVHVDWAACETALAGRQFWFFTSKTTRSFYDVSMRMDDVLVFGSETSGMPPEIADRYNGRDVILPMREPRARCLNLSSAASIAVYELLRNTGALTGR